MNTQEPITINIQDKRQGMSSAILVLPIGSDLFRALENEIIDCRLTYGTEFKTAVDDEGFHEIIEITKKSSYTTRRFLLNESFSESDYRLLGAEIIKQGGFWQTDFGGLVTINLPENGPLDIDAIFKIFDFNPIEVKD